ncbi:MAG: hypothetical protein IJ592_02405, partial [Candidatus Methanomethylophilaceae archaeon]|nr:hypothetical protein [Candidatus Methanomethylophilaceae archaeon]
MSTSTSPANTYRWRRDDHLTEREELANQRFSCTERERAVFEAGIKMATIYHQFVGT